MKKAVAVVVLYTAVMAAGMAYVKSSSGVGYSDPTFLEHFFWILFGLAVATILYCLIFRRETTLPWSGKRHWTIYAIVMVPLVIALIIGLALFSKPTWSFFAPLIATLFVGIGEEIAFRHVLFGALLKKNARQGMTVVSAVIISALAFSALHAVNILGGQTVAQVAIQLVLTFLAGILFAGLYLQTKSLLAIIAFHWFWDALTFMGLEKQIPAMAVIMPLLLIIQSVLGLVILRKYRNLKASDVLEQPLT